MENGEEHSNAFECCIRMKNIRMLEKSPLGGGMPGWECWVRHFGVSAPEKKKKTPKKTPDFLIWKDARMITAAWTSHCMSTLTNTLLLQLFSTVKKKKHSNGIRTGLNFECSNASNAISNAVPRKNAFHSYEECNPFEILECIQVRKSETQEWHSNIRMENGGPFECIRMFIPRTCEGLYRYRYGG